MGGQHLGRLLLKLFSQGELSGTCVWDLASAAFIDGWGHDNSLARRLVRCGQSGKARNHIAADLMKVAEAEGLTCSTAQAYKFQLGTGGKDVHMFLPHEFYPAMVAKGGDPSDWCLSPELLEDGCGLAGLLRDWASHEDVLFQGDLSAVGVLGFHCDGVQYTSSMRAGGAKSIVVGSMNVISAASPSLRHRRHPLFVLRKTRLCDCGCQGFHTLQELMDVLAWSMGCLARGQTPTCRHDGQDWTEEDRLARSPSGQPLPKAALLQLRGDWEWFESCFRVRSVSSESFCWMCNAVQKVPGPLNYHDFRPQAAHRNTLINHEDYMGQCAREGTEPSHVFRCPGLKIEHLAVDAMHSGDLGTFADAVGSLFWLEISHKGWHRNKRRGLESLNSDLNQYYLAHHDQNLSKLSPLVLSQILGKSPGFPFLKAKAAQVRHAAEFCLSLAKRHQAGDQHRPAYEFKRNSRMHPHTARHLELLVSLFEGFLGFTMSCSATPFVTEDCRKAMYQYLQSLEALHKLWRLGVPVALQRPLPFHLRPKAHACQHLVEEKIEAFGSPNQFWCYRDEDFIGTVKGIAHKTKHPATLEQRVIEKLRIWAALEYSD